MNLLLWAVFGAIAGWLASTVMRTDGEQNMLADIILGVIGAGIGGLLMNIIGQPGVTGFNLYSMFVALLGAVALLWIYKAITGRRI